MKEALKISVIFLVLISLYAAGCLIFTKGFLLKRFVVNENSSCSVDFSAQSDDHGDDGCWQHSRFKRAIIIVIDALKYEFMKYDRNLKSETPYLNKLPILNNILTRQPKHARLYKFIADPPTTTLQRLKGLTTGSLPTFVDAGANFATPEITEDNIIDQLIKQNKDIKFLGDDTWMGLFPNRFSKSFSYPSFNVKDLHTVDNGILKHLLPEMRKFDWNVIIAHFLGVDHCGHRFGPNHPEMGEKLTQMDQMLRNVTRIMKEDTILFVFGDHGMTRSGDHGGDSDDELEAGLFVYSPAQLTATAINPEEVMSVAQTDLVPTLALLLGVPIPFSNLGMVIKDLFTFCSWWKTGTSEIKQVYHAIKSLRLNAQQISAYVKSYATLSSDFPADKMRRLSSLLDHAESDLQALLTSMVKEGETPNILSRFHRLEEHYTEFISEVRNTCQGIWAKFDLLSIVTGVLTMAVGLILNVLIYRILCNPRSVSATPVYVATSASAVYVVYAVLQTGYLGEYVGPLMLYVYGGTLFLLVCLAVKNSFTEKEKSEDSAKSPINFDDVFASVICLLYVLVYFSNSFVVQEDSVTLFFTQTMVWIFGFKLIKQNFSRHQQKSHKEAAVSRQSKSKSSWNPLFLLVHPATITLAVTVTCSTLLRLSASFRICREERWSCNNTIFSQSLSNLAVDNISYRNTRYFFSVISLALFVVCGRQWMKVYGNLNGFSPTVMCAKFAYPLAGICCGLHWAAQGLPVRVLDALPWWQQILLAQLVYVSVCLSLLSLALQPLCVYKLPALSDRPVPGAYQGLQGSQVIPRLYRQLQQSWSQPSEGDEEKPPVVYGLGSVYSAGVLHLAVGVGLVLALLLGDGMTPGLVCGGAALFLLLEMHSAALHRQDEASDGLLPVPWSLLVTHGLFMSTFFFATGHQATVPAIRFESAFTGFHGDFNWNVIPALLITLNTFASHVFFLVVSPLLIFWPHLGGPLSQLMRFVSKSEGEWRGDFLAYDDREVFKKTAMRVVCGMLLFSALKVFGSMCAAGLHRRHLMVWKIFAPRFVFEGAAMFVTIVVLLLVFCFLLRLHRAVHSFAKLLSKDR